MVTAGKTMTYISTQCNLMATEKTYDLREKPMGLCEKILPNLNLISLLEILPSLMNYTNFRLTDVI